MKTCGRIWWSVVLVIAAFGAAEALLAIPSSVAWTAATGGAVLGVLCCFTFFSRPGSRKPSPGLVAGVACRGALAGVVLAGLSVLPGAVAAAILVGAVCLHPRTVVAVVVRVRRRLDPAHGSAPAPTHEHEHELDGAAARTPPGPPAWVRYHPTEQVPPAPASDPFTPPDAASVRLLGTAQLCWAWRVSFRALERSRDGVDPVRWAALVELRQRYLDEIERRDPAGFARWLYSGARPASDPSRFLLPGRASQAALPRSISSDAAPSSAAEGEAA